MKIVLLAFTISILFISSVSAQPAAGPSQSDNQLAFDLYSRLAPRTGNIFFSPYSLSSVLGMAYEGARGATAQEMRDVLHLSADDAAIQVETPAGLSVANALWAQKAYPFKDDYLNLVKSVYFAEARNLDFVADPEGSRLIINNWVSDRTKNRINDLLPAGSIKPDVRLVLTDAIYFKGQWQKPFKKQNTKLDAFWLTPDQSMPAEMMSLEGESFGYTDNEHVQVLRLPYQGNDLSMLVILPRSKNVQGLESILSLERLKQWQGEMIYQRVNIFLPKFKFDASYQMKDILMDLGMKNAFDRSADFSGMTGHAGFYIDQIYHKAWIDTNEEGTEAAAATGMVLKGMAMMVPLHGPKIFRADHPFIFLVQDNKTGRILFMGRVSNLQ